jgi:hypothetical protein
MAPEQLDPARVGPASDQYSLACVAYEVLTGRRPFGAGTDDVMAVLLAHRTEPVPPAGSSTVDAVFKVALAKSPTDRYPTVRDFAAALTGALHGAPRPARSRSRRLLLAGGVVVVAAGAVAAFIFLPGGGETPAGGEPPAGEAPAGWTTIRGPGDTTFDVPAGWQRQNAGAVVTFTDSDERVLVVGGATSDAEPATDLTSLYQCSGTVDTASVAGLPAAACDANGQHVTVVAAGDTLVRFAFAGTVSDADRDQVLATLEHP